MCQRLTRQHRLTQSIGFPRSAPTYFAFRPRRSRQRHAELRRHRRADARREGRVSPSRAASRGARRSCAGRALATARGGKLMCRRTSRRRARKPHADGLDGCERKNAPRNQEAAPLRPLQAGRPPGRPPLYSAACVARAAALPRRFRVRRETLAPFLWRLSSTSSAPFARTIDDHGQPGKGRHHHGRAST